MTKTEQALTAIFRHCDEVAEGKRPSRSEKEGRQVALAWLGVKENGMDEGRRTQDNANTTDRL